MNALVALAIFLAGFGAAWSWQGARADADIADLRLTHSGEALAATIAAATRLKAAQTLADTLTRQRGQREADLDHRLQETQRALKTATTGRPCLGGAALRVLDQSPGLRPIPGAAPAGAPDRGSAAAAADPADGTETETASDTDVAGWIADAGRYYERCRGRLADIRAFEAGQ